MYEVFERVKVNQEVEGVGRESLAQFEDHLKNNLYEIWNRLSSGNYFRPPVKEEIPKKAGDCQRIDGGRSKCADTGARTARGDGTIFQFGSFWLQIYLWTATS